MLKKVLLTPVLLFVASGLLFAQATATINGRAVDQASLVLPGATVTVTNTATGASRETVTNAEGLYSVPALNPGLYDVQVTLAGFAPSVTKGVDLVTGSTLTVDFQLGIAQLEETVTVSGQSPLVEITQAAVSSSIRQSEVQQLPMLNRSLAAMMTLLPGAREVPAQGAHGHAASYVSFGGSAGRNYQMIVDGVDNKEDHDGGTTMVYSLEGVEEFRALTSGYSAEYGKAATVVVLATRSGTNQLSGSLFGYGRNEALTTTDYFSKPENGGQGKQPFSRAQYGGSIGGPIRRDRAWYFGSLERIQQEFTLPRPDNLYRQLLILESLGIGAVASRSISQPFRDTLAQAKINVQLSQNSTAFVRYALQDGYVDNGSVNTGRALLAWSPRSDRNAQHMRNWSAGWTWLVNPTTVNEFRWQWLYYDHDNIYPPCAPGSYDLSACLPHRLTFPSVSAGASNGFPHWHNLETKVEFKNDLTKQLGSHGLKFGVDYMHVPVYGGIFGGGSPGNMSFFDDPSVIVNNTNGRYPQGFRTPGIVRTITVATGTIGDYGSLGARNFGAYLQDDFKMSSRLTLNLGLRYDVYRYMNQPQMQENRFYQALRDIGSPFGRLPKTDANNVSPRVGVAWDVRGDGRDVLRAGFGLFYGQGIMNSYYQQNQQAKAIIYFSQNYTNSRIGSGQLANFVYGLSPLPTAPFAPTELPVGQSSQGNWYHPDLKDALTEKYSVGFSHMLGQDTVLAADYSHIIGRNGWRNININPLLDHDDNPATARIRPLSAETLRVYGDPNRLGPTRLVTSVARSLYDELIVHFERRSARAAFQVNYTLAWARGYGGSADGTTEGGYQDPQTPSATGGELFAPWEWGPTPYDERHRVTLAGNFNLPFDIDVSPSITAATARPYTQWRGSNPSGDGLLQLVGPDGNPVGLFNARGKALVNANARVTKNLRFAGAQRISLFAEFYNMLNRANFGGNYGSRADQPATYNQPNGYLGGIGSTSTIPISFQVQFGARYTF